jgi:hypothetical protein
MAVRSGFRVWNDNGASIYLIDGDSGCRFHGQLSCDPVLGGDERHRNLPESSPWSHLQLFHNNQYGDDRNILDNASGNLSDYSGLY